MAVTPRFVVLVFLGALALGALGGVAGVILMPPPDALPPAPPRPVADDAPGTTGLRGSMEAFRLHAVPRDLPDLAFRDAEERPVTLADFRGRIVLLNLWATWCAPCVEEMPALDRMQTALGGEHFTVVALSIDRQGKRIVDPFVARLNTPALPIYLDPSGASARTLAVAGLPTTLLIDREGRELGRIAGAVPWDNAAAAELIRLAIGLPTMPAATPRPAAAPRPPAGPAAPAAPAAPADALPEVDRHPDIPGADRADLDVPRPAVN
ncbi:MAG: TlpA family protein disulfide reductase [Alphaproteobacteria bacterium]|nr:TlpA family protein disulfide reductase [Alphaproteobacteria bacterium]